MSKLGNIIKNLLGISEATDPRSNYYKGKTIGNLLQALLLPFILVYATWYLSNTSSQLEVRTTTEGLYETRLQSYLEKMEKYLLENELDSFSEQSRNDFEQSEYSVLDLAQAQTVTALRFLNTTRQNIVFQFLRDTNLSDSLLIHASMRGITLRRTDMGRLVLMHADLTNANLSEASLWRTDLTKANLWGANLNRGFPLEC